MTRRSKYKKDSQQPSVASLFSESAHSATNTLSANKVNQGEKGDQHDNCTKGEESTNIVCDKRWCKTNESIGSTESSPSNTITGKKDKKKLKMSNPSNCDVSTKGEGANSIPLEPNKPSTAIPAGEPKAGTNTSSNDEMQQMEI